MHCSRWQNSASVTVGGYRNVCWHAGLSSACFGTHLLLTGASRAMVPPSPPPLVPASRFLPWPSRCHQRAPHPPCNDGRSTCHTPLQTDRCFIAASAPLYLHQPVIGVDCTKHCTNLFKIAPLHYQSQIG